MAIIALIGAAPFKMFGNHMMPRPMAEKGVDMFLEAIQDDMFSAESLERLFGV